MADRFIDGQTITADSTSVTTTFELLATTTGLAVTGQTKDTCCAYYWRPGASPVSIPLTNLATVGAAYSSGGMIELGNTSFCGRYRIDLPDLAVRQNADFVELHVWAAGAKPFRERYALTTGKTVASCVLNQRVESCGSYTLQQAMSIILAAAAGVSDSGGTIRRTPDGCTTRITATIDSSNNRTSITLTPSS